MGSDVFWVGTYRHFAWFVEETGCRTARTHAAQASKKGGTCGSARVLVDTETHATPQRHSRLLVRGKQAAV
jgi:hypothetical protein